MMHFWLHFGHYHSLGGKSLWDIITSLSQVAIAFAAFLALNTWKKQMKGGGKYEVAKKLVMGSRKMQEMIQNNVRNPGLHPAEVGVQHNQYNYQYLVYQKRLKEMYDYKRENFDENAIEAEILLGNKIKDIVFEFNKKIDELRVSIYIGYGMLTGDENQDRELWKQAGKKITQNRGLLWNTGLEEDKYSQEVEQIVNKFKKELSQYIQ